MSKWGRILPQTHRWWCSDLQDWVYTLETDTETLSSLVSNTRLRLRFEILESRDWNLGFLKTEIFRCAAKIVETKTFSRLSSISLMISPIAAPLQSRHRSHYFMVYFIVWSWLLVVRCRQITNYLTGQSCQGNNYLIQVCHQITFPISWTNNYQFRC